MSDSKMVLHGRSWVNLEMLRAAAAAWGAQYAQVLLAVNPRRQHAEDSRMHGGLSLPCTSAVLVPSSPLILIRPSWFETVHYVAWHGDKVLFNVWAKNQNHSFYKAFRGEIKGKGFEDASSDRMRSDNAVLLVGLNTRLMRMISALRSLSRSFFRRSLVTYLSKSKQAMKKYYLT